MAVAKEVAVTTSASWGERPASACAGAGTWPVLAYAAAEAGAAAPQLATLRAIYRRRMSLFEHQRLAALATVSRPPAKRSSGC
jgi:hypothetical protein